MSAQPAEQPAAAALHRLLELTECRCGYRGLHSTFCLAEYRQDIEALVRAIPGETS